MHFTHLLAPFLLFGVALCASVAQPPCTTAVASPTPSGYHCGDQGTLQNPALLATTTAKDQTTCRDSCLSNKACISFSYSATKKQCITSTKTLVAQGFKKSTSGVYYYNRKCYTITCPTCPASQSYCSNLKNCTNLQTDNANCGSCGNACSFNQYCSSGVCACTPSTTFNLQVQNSGTCHNDGNYLALLNNSQPGLAYSVATKIPASSSPVFYITYFNGDGACSPSGTLTLTKPGSQDKIGYTDSTGNQIVHFNAPPNTPPPGDLIGNCRVDYTNNNLICTSGGNPGFWFACCEQWRFGTDDEIIAFNKTRGNCQKMDMVVQYVLN